MKKLLILLTTTLLLAACQQAPLFDEQRHLPSGIWNRFTPETFTIDVAKPETYYNINIEIAVDTAHFRYTSLPLTVNLYSPNSERRMFYAEIPLTENGRPKGEMSGGYRIVNQRVRSYFSFNSRGEHRMEIGQATSQYDLEGIDHIRLHIEKAPLDLPE